jgi:hypothetical protein
MLYILFKSVYFADFTFTMTYGVIFWEIQQTAKRVLHPKENRPISGNTKKRDLQRTVLCNWHFAAVLADTRVPYFNRAKN